MMGYTVAINSVFAIMIAETYLFGNVKSGTADSTFLLNLLFYIIITPIITVTLTKMMYAGKNTMVVEDALSRIEEERRHLCEYDEDTANGSRLEPVDSRKTSGDRKKLLFHVSTGLFCFIFYELVVKY